MHSSLEAIVLVAYVYPTEKGQHGSFNKREVYTFFMCDWASDPDPEAAQTSVAVHE